NRRRELGEQVEVKLGVAGGGNLPDLAGQILADAWNLAQRRFVERRQLVGMIACDIDHVAIRANLERVLALDFEEVRNFLEDAGDGGVSQPEGLPSRWESRGVAGRPASEPRRRSIHGPAVHSRTDTPRRRRHTPSPPSRPRSKPGASSRRSPGW